METINGIFTANPNEIREATKIATDALVNAIANGKNVSKILRSFGAGCLIDVHPSKLTALTTALSN